MSEFKLYAIELENKKVFLQVSTPIREQLLLQQCRVMVKFVHNNPPIRIIHTMDIDDVLKVNYWVKYFMRYYGIDNVRGGDYKDEILSPRSMQVIREEIGATFDSYEDNIETFENVLTEYNEKTLDLEEKKRLENRLTDYKNRQKLLQYLPVYDGLLEDLEWLKNEITNTRLIYDIPDKIKNGRGFNVLSNYYSANRFCANTYDKDRYKTILKRLKEFIVDYYSLTSKDDPVKQFCCDAYLRNKLISFVETKIDNDALLINPAFTLDNFFLHPHIIMNWVFQVNLVDELIDKWSSMYYSIKNWRDEIEFDLSSYPKDFEKYTKYTLRLYEIRL